MRSSFLGEPVWNRLRREELGGSLVKAQASAQVGVPAAPRFVLLHGPRSPTRVYFFFFARMLGSVHDRQPTVILRVSAMKR